MQDFSKFNIEGTNYYGHLLIYHILSIVDPMTHVGTSNMNINFGEI